MVFSLSFGGAVLGGIIRGFRLRLHPRLALVFPLLGNSPAGKLVSVGILPYCPKLQSVSNHGASCPSRGYHSPVSAHRRRLLSRRARFLFTAAGVSLPQPYGEAADAGFACGGFGDFVAEDLFEDGG